MDTKKADVPLRIAPAVDLLIPGTSNGGWPQIAVTLPARCSAGFESKERLPIGRAPNSTRQTEHTRSTMGGAPL